MQGKGVRKHHFSRRKLLLAGSTAAAETYSFGLMGFETQNIDASSIDQIARDVEAKIKENARKGAGSRALQ